MSYFDDNKNAGIFGITYLDAKLNGFLKTDLVLIGARSGAGKTTLARIIAKANARGGKKVLLMSLENFEDDDFYTDVYFKYKKITDENMSLREFLGGGEPKNKKALEQAEEEVRKENQNITLVSRQANFTIDDIKGWMMKAMSDGYDLVIIDHLDYVDKYNANDTDNSHVTELMKAIRDAQDIARIPVIAFSHLRKTANAKTMPAVPSIDEFIGSSNKVKEATIVIMLAPNDKANEELVKSGLETRKATYIAIRKDRFGGISNKTGLVTYDLKEGRYLNGFDEEVVSYGGDVVE